MPDQIPPMQTDMNAQMPMNGSMDMGGANGESQFDTGFDAGVEADEEEDPKKFIQQLTGKLSQSLNSYNNEMGDDEELSKYVGKMIVRAAAKGLDEKGRKELIKSINTTEEPDDEGEEDIDVEVDTDETEQMPQQPQPIQECMFTKAETRSLASKVRKALKESNKGTFSKKNIK